MSNQFKGNEFHFTTSDPAEFVNPFFYKPAPGVEAQPMEIIIGVEPSGVADAPTRCYIKLNGKEIYQEIKGKGATP